MSNQAQRKKATRRKAATARRAPKHSARTPRSRRAELLATWHRDLRPMIGMYLVLVSPFLMMLLWFVADRLPADQRELLHPHAIAWILPVAAAMTGLGAMIILESPKRPRMPRWLYVLLCGVAAGGLAMASRAPGADWPGVGRALGLLLLAVAFAVATVPPVRPPQERGADA